MIISIYPLLAILSCIVSAATDCHYTCFTCTTSSYTACTSCEIGHFFVLKDPKQVLPEYKTSNRPEGICADQIDDNVAINAMGLILVLFCVILIPLANTNRLFYIVSTLQSIGLLGLIQIYWGNILSYQFYALQYLMPFNLIFRAAKEQTVQFNQRYFFRLGQYFVNPSLLSSMAIVGILDIIIFFLIIFCIIVLSLKRKYCADSCRVMVCSQWFLQKLIKVLVTLYFMMIQETILAISVALQFEIGDKGPVIGITVIYLLTIVGFSIVIFQIKIPYFPNKVIQYQCISKKIIYPIFLIVPPHTQYTLLIIMMINIALQIIFDGLNKTYPLKSMQTAYRANQVLIMVFIMVYYFVQTNQNQQSVSEVLAGVSSGFLNLMMMWIIVEGIIGIKDRFCEKKGQIKPQISEVQREETLQNINEIQLVKNIENKSSMRDLKDDSSDREKQVKPIKPAESSDKEEQPQTALESTKKKRNTKLPAIKKQELAKAYGLK